jgi:hypothetical protein
LRWERAVTVPRWNQRQAGSVLPVLRVPQTSISSEWILATGSINSPSNEYLNSVQSFFLTTQDGKSIWLKHPYNLSDKVPFSNQQPERGDQLIADHTASRSVVTTIDGRKVGVKMPTDHPFGPIGAVQPTKIELYADIRYAVPRSRVIQELDSELTSDTKNRVLLEIGAVFENKSRNGFILRDLSPLGDGNYYFPAHVVPTVYGKQVAQSNGNASESDFWNQHWAQRMGEFQAHILLRWGISLRALNPQNFLIQLDRDLKPTGVIFWRDIAESHIVTSMMKAKGFDWAITQDQAWGGWGNIQKPSLDCSHIDWNFFQSNRELVTREWQNTCTTAFLKTLQAELNVDNADMLGFMTTSEGINKWLEWRKRNSK